MRFRFALLALSVTTIGNAAQPSRFQFVEVIEVSPQYVQVPCDSCGPLPDLRFTGTKFKYRCNGDLYENWTAGPLHAGVHIQVIDCSNVVVTKNRKLIFRDRNQ
jgi:hypothetical protein